MTKKYVQPGMVLTLTNGSGADVSSGGGLLVGKIFGLATGDVADTEEGEFSVVGVHAIAKTAAQTFSVGDLVYWDDTAKEATSTSAGNELIGVATKAAAGPDDDVECRLNGISTVTGS